MLDGVLEERVHTPFAQTYVTSITLNLQSHHLY